MSDLDRDLCRKAAAECAELARMTTDPATREALLARSQEAKARVCNSAEMQRALDAFNDQQMGPPGPVQRQPMQQQQSKAEPEDDN